MYRSFVTAWVLVLLAGASPAAAMTLEEAMAVAYASNPRLEAARAELRAVDEEYAQAKSGYRPTVEAGASYISSNLRGDVSDSSSDPKTLEVGLVQPLYRGGTTAARVETADARIMAQRALLVSEEQAVLLDAVTSYMNVLRDQEIVRLNASNEKVLQDRLREAEQRFALGDITKTDVSQAQARLSNATAGRISAEANEQSSRAYFERTIGSLPGDMHKPDLSKIMIPATLDSALGIAAENNPAIVFSRHTLDAAGRNVQAIEGEKLPQVDLTAGAGKIFDPASRADDHVTSTSIGVVATIPLYAAGGATDSRIRQARQVEQQRRLEQNREERGARQTVIDAWADLTAANAEIAARRAQIEAAQLALDGVRIETEYGSRTTLDLLDAEQEYLDAQVAYISAERNKTVAVYALLASMGELTARHLGLPVEGYDPLANFRNVNDKWAGTSITP